MRTSRRWIKNVDAGIVVAVVMLVASLSGVLGTALGAVHGAVLATVGGLSATAAAATAAATAATADATERRPRLYLYPPAPRLLPTAEQASSAPTPALERIVAGMRAGFVDQTGLDGLAATHDPRQAWFVADLLRFYQGTDSESGLVVAFRKLTGVDPSGDPMFADSAWLSVTNHLFAWALPAPANYREFKGRMFTLVEPKWKPFFADAHSEIDWRYVSWGGVQLDDRPLGTTTGCAGGCIPALDDPAMTSAKAGSWYPDSATVFGIVEGSEAVAFPKNIMEVHEMVNTTIGGRRMAIPYCTLCGSAQAYFIDHVRGANQPLVLRTSGLLTRSNKVMFELNTRSVFDTFTGRAVSGSLHDNKVSLVETSVTTSTWAAWKLAHPNTKIVARDGGIGEHYPADPLRGRDNNGPIFPIGPPDRRLPVQAKIVGVVVVGGKPVAFPVAAARRALSAGREVSAGGVRLLADGDGFRARRVADGSVIAAHEAFWFAWSQFHRDTIVWTPLNSP